MSRSPESPRVSIVIPTYNGQEFIAESLASASAQTLSDIEILVVDDGSSDQTVGLTRQHAARDPRIRLIENESNLGLVGNWNRCLEIARGEWIKFLFQDDTLEPSCTEKMVAAGESTGLPFVVCGRRVIEGEGADPQVVRILNEMPTLLKMTKRDRLTSQEFANLHAGLLWVNLECEPPCVMINKSLPVEIGPFDPLFRQLCDLEYWLRAGASHGVALVHENLASFRVHGTSTTSSNRTRKVNVTDVDEALLSRKVQTDPRFSALRAAFAEQPRDRYRFARLSALAHAHAHRYDSIFSSALQNDRTLQGRYLTARFLYNPARRLRDRLRTR